MTKDAQKELQVIVPPKGSRFSYLYYRYPKGYTENAEAEQEQHSAQVKEDEKET